MQLPEIGAESGHRMLTKRHAKILKLLESEGTASIAALADRLGVSQETVRRDVRPLTENGSLVRVHGRATGIS